MTKPPAADANDWRDLIWIYNQAGQLRQQCEHFVRNGASFGEDTGRSFFVHELASRIEERACRWRLRAWRRQEAHRMTESILRGTAQKEEA